jgi:hypothetical protein
MNQWTMIMESVMVIYWSTTEHQEDSTNIYKIQGSHSDDDNDDDDDDDDNNDSSLLGYSVLLTGS